MKKSFLFGISFAVVLFIVGFFTDYAREVGSISLGIAIILIAIGGFVSGAFISGDQIRANYNTEPEKDRLSKRRVLFNSAIIAVPLFIVGTILLSM